MSAVPEQLRGASLIEQLSWADCGIEQDEHGLARAVDCLTGEVIEDPWAWLRAAHGRFDAFEALVEDTTSVVVEVRAEETGRRCAALLGALGYRVEVRRAG